MLLGCEMFGRGVFFEWAVVALYVAANLSYSPGSVIVCVQLASQPEPTSMCRSFICSIFSAKGFGGHHKIRK